MTLISLSRASLVVGLLAVACTSNKTIERERPQANAEVIAPAPAPTAPRASRLPANRLAALDTAHFSAAFIAGLKESIQRENYAVRGRWLLLSPTDSVAFPAELPANAPVTYAATAQNKAYTLTVTRRNYSTVRYVAEIRQAGKVLARQQGTADLNPSFYATPEMPVDTRNETAYSAYEFVTTAPRQQGFAVLIGMGQDVDKAEIYATTAQGQPLAAWQNVPTLRRR